MNDESSVLLIKRFSRDPNRSPGQETITEFVMDAVARSDGALRPSSSSDEFSPELMLRLITYCYAKGVYSSDEIERKLRKSPVRQPFPDAKSIQRFRRHNRAALQTALERTLQAIYHSAPGEKTPTVIRAEAAEKLEMAAIFDMSLEE
jgi:hypothetical protein